MLPPVAESDSSKRLSTASGGVVAFNRTKSQAEILISAISILRDTEEYTSNNLFLDESRYRVCTRLYLPLSNSYKSWRVEAGHRTLPAKIAAITALSIMVSRPLQGPQSKAAYYVNPLLAMLTGVGITGTTLEHCDVDLIRRLSHWFDTLRLPSADSVRDNLLASVSKNERFVPEDYEIKLTFEEIAQIDAVVSIFELLKLSGKP